MELNTKVYLINDNGDKFMGIGVLWLLEAIAESASLRQAAKKMNLSYSKAYSMLSQLEKSLKREVVQRKKGGQLREGLELTPFAFEFMALYKDFHENIKKETKKVFGEFESSLNALMEE